jgi:hypothetical protein
MTPRDTRYKAFPPGWSNIQVPTHSKAATLAGIATYTPCGPTGVWGQRVAWTLAKLGGARLLPGRGRSWDPPFATDSWQTLLRELAAAAGPFDSHTVYERRRGRRGLLMLLLDGDRPVGFVKAAEEDPPGIAREEEALLAAERVGVDSFLTPRVLGSGLIAGWRYVVASPMPPLMHRMLSQAPAEAILEDIALVLADIERPADAPSHWQPFHGDFAPWNLRHIGGGTPWLIDWEDAGWAPPRADWVFYVATAAALGYPITSDPLERTEAVEYWWEEVDRRAREKLDSGLALRQLDYGLMEALAAGARS